ncbi:MAG: RagB/SusD family nutrient uptake outer membrane protein, partial [Flavobacteriaceae bacterium]|nr:RagB/SusD family nutrient uptake outer membrane protein [Flavobacteriaceae bacterium]
MRHLKLYSIVALLMIAFMASCSKDFIEVAPEGKPLEDSYYRNEAEATAALIAVYDVTRKNSGGFENMITMMNAGSDDHFAGGGGATDGAGIQGFSNYTITPITIPASFWNDHYQGIFRANILLQKLPSVDMSDALKTRFEAESKALRALYYFNLVRMFKNVPLILEPLTPADMYNVLQANP